MKLHTYLILSNFRKTSNEILSLFKPITNFLVVESKCLCSPGILGWNKDMMPNDSTIVLWTALVESICEFDSGSAKGINLSNLLLWPMRNMSLINNVCIF